MTATLSWSAADVRVAVVGPAARLRSAASAIAVRFAT